MFLAGARRTYDRMAIVTSDFRLSDELPPLLRAARAFLPATGLGVLTPDGDAHAVLRWAMTYGMHAHRVELADLPPMLQQSPSSVPLQRRLLLRA